MPDIAEVVSCGNVELVSSDAEVEVVMTPCEGVVEDGSVCVGVEDTSLVAVLEISSDVATDDVEVVVGTTAEEDKTTLMLACTCIT